MSQIIAFDLYGTLLSTSSIALQLKQHFGEKAQSIATEWRRYQLEYTWRLNSMGRFESFADVTRNSLLHALKNNGVSLGERDISGLMEAYDSLSTFPDVGPALEQVNAAADLTPVVFSNGTMSMVSNSVNGSPGLSPHSAVFNAIITVDSVQQYKPAPAVYKYLAEKMGKAPSEMSQMWLISGNPFDVVGARSCGMKAIWVDRENSGWNDAVLPYLLPTAIVHSLEEVVDKVRSHL